MQEEGKAIYLSSPQADRTGDVFADDEPAV